MLTPVASGDGDGGEVLGLAPSSQLVRVRKKSSIKKTGVLLTEEIGNRLQVSRSSRQLPQPPDGHGKLRTVLPSTILFCPDSVRRKWVGGMHSLLVDVAGLFSFDLRDPSGWLKMTYF